MQWMNSTLAPNHVAYDACASVRNFRVLSCCENRSCAWPLGSSNASGWKKRLNLLDHEHGKPHGPAICKTKFNA